MWLVGIDEAGYGPNLGPLVMTSVACRVPSERAARDLWKVLRKAVRRHGEEADSRPLVADSKQVYSPARGLSELERGVLGTVGRRGAPPGAALERYLQWISPTDHPEVRAEIWFTGQTRLPVHLEDAELDRVTDRFDKTCRQRDLTWGVIRSVVVCPSRFNSLADRWGSKAAVLGLGLTDLLAANQSPDDNHDDVLFIVDKHGGRNHYSVLVQHALPDGMVLAEEEGALRSSYNVLGLSRQVHVIFEPRADVEHFCVALASMCSKYLRELLMLEFNRFWQERVPGLKPTAGYPGDSERFFREIRPTATGLGVVDDALWRRK